jgi:hypothetical protein
VKFEIPLPLQREHEALHRRLRKAARLPGEVGELAVRPRRFLGHAALRRGADHDAARGEVVHHLTAAPLPERLVPADRASGAVAGRREGERLRLPRHAHGPMSSSE